MNQPLAWHFLYGVSFKAHGTPCDRCCYLKMGTLMPKAAAPPVHSLPQSWSVPCGGPACGVEREASLNVSHPASRMRSLLRCGDHLLELAALLPVPLLPGPPAHVYPVLCTEHVSQTLWFCLWVTSLGRRDGKRQAHGLGLAP